MHYSAHCLLVKISTVITDVISGEKVGGVEVNIVTEFF